MLHFDDLAVCLTEEEGSAKGSISFYKFHSHFSMGQHPFYDCCQRVSSEEEISQTPSAQKTARLFVTARFFGVRFGQSNGVWKKADISNRSGFDTQQ